MKFEYDASKSMANLENMKLILRKLNISGLMGIKS